MNTYLCITQSIMYAARFLPLCFSLSHTHTPSLICLIHLPLTLILTTYFRFPFVSHFSLTIQYFFPVFLFSHEVTGENLIWLYPGKRENKDIIIHYMCSSSCSCISINNEALCQLTDLVEIDDNLPSDYTVISYKVLLHIT